MAAIPGRVGLCCAEAARADAAELKVAEIAGLKPRY
jgi:hypothetical protein